MTIANDMFNTKSTNISLTSPKASTSPAIPAAATPPGTGSPFQAAEKRKSDRTSNEENMARRSSSDANRRSSAVGAAVDADQLQKVLREYDEAGRARDTTPGGSPARKRQRVYGDRYDHFQVLVVTNAPLTTDRFIPNREGQDLQASFSLLHDEGSPATPSKQKKRTPHGELHFQRSKMNLTHLFAAQSTDTSSSRRSEPYLFHPPSVRDL